MHKRLIVSLAAVFGFALLVQAQEFTAADNNLRQEGVFGPFARTYAAPLPLTLGDGLPVSLWRSFAWTEAAQANFLPALAMEAPIGVSPATASRRESAGKPVDLVPRLDYVHGEVGFLYGTSLGKSGGELKQGYIFGATGNDKFQISVGAVYTEANGRFWR